MHFASIGEPDKAAIAGSADPEQLPGALELQTEDMLPDAKSFALVQGCLSVLRTARRDCLRQPSNESAGGILPGQENYRTKITRFAERYER